MGVRLLDLPDLPALSAMAGDEPVLLAVRDESPFELAARIVAIEAEDARQLVALRNHDLLGSTSPSNA